MSPKANRIFASCDPVYFHQHAKSFIKSAVENGMDVHIHAIDPTDRVIGSLNKYIADYPGFYYTTEVNAQAPSDRTYFASNRYLVLPEIMKDNPGVSFLVTDIDAFFLRPFPFPVEKKIGVMLREPLHGGKGWEGRGTRIAAGIVYVRHDAVEFIEEVRRRLRKLERRWFVDQVALYEAYEYLYSDKQDEVFHFDLEHHDWEFQDGSFMWSGKGPRKNKNERYLEAKKTLET